MADEQGAIPEGRKLLALAERCEKAEGPDRELDALIRCAVFAPADAFVKLSPFNGEWCIYEIGYGGKERGWEPRGLSYAQRSGAFTASLDAAMTLVPAEYDWIVGDVNGAWGGTPYACVGSKDEHFAATAILALCAAALRARAHTRETSHVG